MSFAVYLIQDAFDKWNTTPVIVGIDPELTSITNEPFPAVTICNLNQALADRVVHLANDSAEYAMLQMLCRRRMNILQTASSSANSSNWEEFIMNVSDNIWNII